MKHNFLLYKNSGRRGPLSPGCNLDALQKQDLLASNRPLVFQSAPNTMAKLKDLFRSTQCTVSSKGLEGARRIWIRRYTHCSIVLAFSVTFPTPPIHFIGEWMDDEWMLSSISLSFSSSPLHIVTANWRFENHLPVSKKIFLCFPHFVFAFSLFSFSFQHSAQKIQDSDFSLSYGFPENPSKIFALQRVNSN